jgi:hypothetical protein
MITIATEQITIIMTIIIMMTTHIRAVSIVSDRIIRQVTTTTHGITTHGITVIVATVHIIVGTTGDIIHAMDGR